MWARTRSITGTGVCSFKQYLSPCLVMRLVNNAQQHNHSGAKTTSSQPRLRPNTPVPLRNRRLASSEHHRATTSSKSASHHDIRLTISAGLPAFASARSFSVTCAVQALRACSGLGDAELMGMSCASSLEHSQAYLLQ